MRFCALALVVCAAGCPVAAPNSKTAPAAGSASPLKLLVVDDEPLGAAIERQWQSEFEGELEVQAVSRADLSQASRLPGDVIVFPAGDIGQLVERDLVRPLDEAALADDKFNRRDIFDQVRLREMVWGQKAVAVPLGSPRLLVVYRRDVFEKLALTPPQTWKDYQAVVERLAAEGMPEHAVMEPLADGWAGQMLLARAAAYVTHRDQVSPLFDYQSLEPLIAGAPYVRALTELVAANKGRAAEQPMTPAEAWAAIRGDKAAMAITWAHPSAQPATAANPAEPAQSGAAALGFELLPGATEVYSFAQQKWRARDEGEETHVPLVAVSGRLAAVTTTTTSAKDSQNFLAWLGSGEVCAAVVPASQATTLFRESQIASAGRFAGGLDAKAARSYAEALAKSSQLESYVALRLPARDEYLAALDAAVQAALSGDQTPADALAAASAKWSEITKRVGIPAQQRALRRDLGLESLP